MRHGHLARPALLLAAVMLCATCAPGVNAAPAPSSFNPFHTDGITMTPFSPGTPGYTLTVTVAWDAHLLYSGTEYPITLVWGVYAVNKTGSSANDFTALGTDNSEWKWDQYPNSGTTLEVGGWLDSPKKEAIVTPPSSSILKSFTYTSFSFTGKAPVLGLHVSVSIPEGKPSPFGSGNTGGIIPSQVPEPSSLLALLFGAASLGGMALRRRLR